MKSHRQVGTARIIVAVCLACLSGGGSDQACGQEDHERADAVARCRELSDEELSNRLDKLLSATRSHGQGLFYECPPRRIKVQGHG
jgi:hypothetical protein